MEEPIQEFEVIEDGWVQFRYSAAEGDYIVERSSDLIDWSERVTLGMDTRIQIENDFAPAAKWVFRERVDSDMERAFYRWSRLTRE